MGIGKLTTGDEFLDKIMYMAIGIMVIVAIIFFILPSIGLVFSVPL